MRRYAYERLTTPDRTAAHTRLRDYFEAVPKKEKIENLNDLAPVIELYHHMVRAEMFDEALELFIQRINDALFYQFGAYQQSIELLKVLLPEDENTPSRLIYKKAHAWVLNQLGNVYALNGEPHRAVSLLERKNKIHKEIDDKENLVVGLVNLALRNMDLGMLRDAEHNLLYQIDICNSIEYEYGESVGRYELGRTLAYAGQWDRAKTSFNTATTLQKQINDIQGQCVGNAYRTLNYLMIGREKKTCKKTAMGDYQSARGYAKRSLGFAKQGDRETGDPNVVDYMRAYWVLGAAYRENKQIEKADKNLSKALKTCRKINIVVMEADILLEVAKLRHAQGESEESLRLVQEALVITERSGYVLQGADVNLFLAELAMEGILTSDEVTSEELAKEYAQKALKLAHCDDGPPYHYKVAYQEAERLLAKLEKQGL